MVTHLEMTVLVDDIPDTDGNGAEHGFSCLLRADDFSLLFDMGQTGLFADHAAAMGVAIQDVDAVILSHGHYDHGGGLSRALALCSHATVYTHPGSQIPRYSRHSDGYYKPVGLPSDARMALTQCSRTTMSTGAVMLNENIGLTGEIPRLACHDEDTGGHFFLDTQGSCRDLLMDEQALWIRTQRGVVIMTGCCHAGIMNTMTHVGTLVPDAPFFALIGGFHLGRASAERIETTVGFLKESGVSLVVPAHCTGRAATERLCADSSFITTPAHSGMSITV